MFGDRFLKIFVANETKFGGQTFQRTEFDCNYIAPYRVNEYIYRLRQKYRKVGRKFLVEAEEQHTES